MVTGMIYVKIQWWLGESLKLIFLYILTYEYLNLRFIFRYNGINCGIFATFHVLNISLTITVG